MRGGGNGSVGEERLTEDDLDEIWADAGEFRQELVEQIDQGQQPPDYDLETYWDYVAEQSKVPDDLSDLTDRQLYRRVANFYMNIERSRVGNFRDEKELIATQEYRQCEADQEHHLLTPFSFSVSEETIRQMSVSEESKETHIKAVKEIAKREAICEGIEKEWNKKLVPAYKAMSAELMGRVYGLEGSQRQEALDDYVALQQEENPRLRPELAHGEVTNRLLHVLGNRLTGETSNPTSGADLRSRLDGMSESTKIRGW